MKSEKIKEMLGFDALQEAENATGKSYKEDKATEALGLMAHVQHGKIKNEMLKGLGDSTLSNTEEDYIKIVTSIGFESALIEPFINEDGVTERLHVMWHREFSILLVFDTHTFGDDGSFAKAGRSVPPPSVNGGKFYYNWSPSFGNKNNCTSSGGYVSSGDRNKTYSFLFNKDYTPYHLPEDLRLIEPKLDWDDYEGYRKSFSNWTTRVDSHIQSKELIKIWCGDHDCREAVKFNISQLNSNGNLIKQWKETPFLWLLHYMDTKEEGYDHKKITQERLNKLPSYVLDIIKVKSND